MKLFASTEDSLWRLWNGDWANDYLKPYKYPIAYRIDEPGYINPPMVERGDPSPGKRVKVHFSEYPNACYTLYLPKNFTNSKKWPLIIEIPGNHGLCDAAHLGYGISKGTNWIWATVPYVDKDGKILKMNWGKDPSYTAHFLVAVLENLKKKYQIDTSKIVLAGFSAGAFAVSAIGNWNDEISSNWAGYFAHSHFDGCCLTGAYPGDSGKRIERLRTKKILITTGNTDITAKSGAHKCSYNAYKKLKAKDFDVTYLEIPHSPPHDRHSRGWICDNTPAANKARKWLRSFLE